MNSKPIRILIVDDHAMVRQGIRAFLETQLDMQIVGEAADGAAALASCSSTAPDVVLLDMLLPGGGVETTGHIHRKHPASRIVILTSSDDESTVLPALRAGALSYVLKDLGPEALSDVVRKAAAGEAVLHPRIATVLSAPVRERAIHAASALSQRERDVLALIAQGLSNQQIAVQLEIGEKTVKSHVSNLLAKLGCSDRTQAAVFAWREGLIAR